MTTIIKPNAGMLKDAARRIEVAIEIGRTDRDLNLLLRQVLTDLDVSLPPVCTHGPEHADAMLTFRKVGTDEYETEPTCYHHIAVYVARDGVNIEEVKEIR